MARPPRIEYPGAFYHVIVRGNHRQDIFLDEQDRREFLGRVKRYKKELGFVLYAFVLMPNHVHLLIETPEVPLSKVMQRINLTYTQYFNRKYNTVGHIFQGRYKSFLCDREEYLLTLVRYIHLNPVRANMVKNPQEYPWSSHQVYLAGSKGLVDSSRALGMLSKEPSRARKRYEEFVDENQSGERDEKLYRGRQPQILGDDDFIEMVERKVQAVKVPLKKPSLQEVLNTVSAVTGVPQEEMESRSRNRETRLARGVLATVWRELGNRVGELQPRIKRDLSVLSRLSRITERGEGKKEVAEVLRKLNARLQA